MESFDDRYSQNLRQLEAFLISYKKAANSIFVPLTKIPADIYPAIDMKPYQEKLAVAKAIITENIDIIKELNI